jgi:hypothetical protein
MLSTFARGAQTVAINCAWCVSATFDSGEEEEGLDNSKCHRHHTTFEHKLSPGTLYIHHDLPE